MIEIFYPLDMWNVKKYWHNKYSIIQITIKRKCKNKDRIHWNKVALMYRKMLSEKIKMAISFSKVRSVYFKYKCSKNNVKRIKMNKRGHQVFKSANKIEQLCQFYCNRHVKSHSISSNLRHFSSMSRRLLFLNYNHFTLKRRQEWVISYFDHASKLPLCIQICSFIFSTFSLYSYRIEIKVNSKCW